MRQIRNALLTALAVVCLTFGSVFAGNLHLTGSTSWSVGSIDVTGSVVGLQTVGVTSGFIRFVGYGFCYDASGNYLTPTDPDQMNNDPNTADDYPETRLNFTNPPNKLDFSMHLVDPNTDGSNSTLPCDNSNPAHQWVWTGATLQVWQNFGDVPGKLWAQQNYSCFPKQNGDFDCKAVH